MSRLTTAPALLKWKMENFDSSQNQNKLHKQIYTVTYTKYGEIMLQLSSWQMRDI